MFFPDALIMLYGLPSLPFQLGEGCLHAEAFTDLSSHKQGRLGAVSLLETEGDAGVCKGREVETFFPGHKLFGGSYQCSF